MTKEATTAYYISKYNDKWNACCQECMDEGSTDVSYDATILFDKTANAEEVAGFYCVFYEKDPLIGWLTNTEGIELSEQDKKVTEILKQIWFKERNRDVKCDDRRN